MANFKNKAYSSTSRSRTGKDYQGFYYHDKQEKKQDKLIQEWLNTKKISNAKL